MFVLVEKIQVTQDRDYR